MKRTKKLVQALRALAIITLLLVPMIAAHEVRAAEALPRFLTEDNATSPIFVTARTVVYVGFGNATICWGTDVPTDARVRYDSRAGKYGMVVEDTRFDAKHCLTLTGLKPSTTYHFIVESTDANGNKVKSRDGSFTTLALPDAEKPLVSLSMADTLSGVAAISADVRDNIAVDRAVFLVDGTPKFTDYAPPFVWKLDTESLPDMIHGFSVRAYDAAGNMVETTRQANVQNLFPPGASPHLGVRITSPENMADTVWGSEIAVEVTDDSEWAQITHLKVTDVWEGRPDVEQVLYDWSYPCRDVFIEGGFHHVCSGGEPPVYQSVSWSTWGQRGLHEVRAEAWDENGNSGSHSIVLNGVTSPPVALTASREVQRYDNYFAVTLRINNIEPYYRISDIIVQDELSGFQATSCSAGAGCEITYTHPAVRHGGGPRPIGSEVRGEYGVKHEVPEGMMEFNYYAVPILSYPLLPIENYRMDLTLTYMATDPANGTSTVHTIRPTEAAHCFSPKELDDAFDTVDYLIVTSPDALHAQAANNPDDANRLLSTVAALAKEKHGVLGYVPAGTTADTIRALISDGGQWDQELMRLGIHYFTGGRYVMSYVYDFYLLLVGETEIVPAFTLQSPNNPSNVIDLSDHPYGDIYGSDGVPDIIVGRIIGNTALDLIIPIETSLAVHEGSRRYDASDALVVSGVDGEEGFARLTHEVGTILEDHGVTVSYQDWRDYSSLGRGAGSRRNSDFISLATGKDIIFYNGHGDPGSWCGGIANWAPSSTTNLDFGGTAPVILSLGCDTGNYAFTYAGPDTSLPSGIAEAFLAHGAALYIGATMDVSGTTGPADELGRVFFRDYFVHEETVGWSFLRSEQALMRLGHAFEVYEFNLYGDPKFGI